MKAFPATHPSEKYQFVDSGMDLRDYFAAKAMEGLLAADPKNAIGYEETIDAIVETAYDIANAMMKAREK
jgi:hypothetical protein